MKKLLLILIFLMLSGCMRAPVSPAEIKKAKELCESNGGLSYLLGSSIWRPTEFKCTNGAEFILQPRDLKDEG